MKRPRLGTFLMGAGVFMRLPRPIPRDFYPMTFIDNILTPCGADGSMIHVFSRDIDGAKVMYYVEAN